MRNGAIAGGFRSADQASESLELVFVVNAAYPEWQKSQGALNAYRAEELITTGWVKVLSKAHGIYQMLRRRIV